MQLLDITKLQTFITIAHEGSFTKAAAYLNLTQPTVSQQIALLEKQLGTPLFVRQPRSLNLTAAGKALLDYAERILALNQDAIQHTLEAAGLAERTLHLGVGHTLAIYLLPDLLRQLREWQPDLQIRIQVGNTADLLTITADGHVDLALVGSPAQHPRLIIQPFMDDRLVIILPPVDPWCEREGATLDDLKARHLITREAGSALHAHVRNLLGPQHLSSDRVTILGETEAIKRSVEAGLGIALVQGIAVQREVKQGSLIAIPLREADDQRTYNVARNKSQPLTPAIVLLLGLLELNP